MRGIDITSREAAEKLNTRWDGPNPASRLPKEWKPVEGIIHDLCHAAVMRSTTEVPPPNLAYSIGYLFDTYESPVASDMSEIRALAVERLVLAKLNAPPRVFATVFISGAKHNLRNLSFEAATAAFSRVRCEKAVAKRAALVLRWLREAIEAS